MPGRTAYEAWDSYVGPMREALRCITPERFVLKESTGGLRPDVDYSVALSDMDSVPLRGQGNLHFVAGQTIKIYEWKPHVVQERYRVTALSYFYGFTTKNEDEELEMLTFQWKRQQDALDSIPIAHLHIGRGLLANPTVIRPGDFHKAHIPTERISLESVVRFAITELGVTASCTDWKEILAASEEAFKLYTTI